METEVPLHYRGEHRLKTGGVLCVPVEEFLVQLRPGRGLADGLGPGAVESPESTTAHTGQGTAP